MDEEVRSKGLVFQTVIYFVISIVFAPLAIGLLSYPDPAWYFGLMFSFTVVAMLISAISNVKKIRKQSKRSKTDQLEMEVAAFARRPNAPVKVEVEEVRSSGSTATTLVQEDSPLLLADWSYTADEWKRFLATEKKVVTVNSILLVVLITVAGGWILHNDEGEGWTFSLAFSFVFACIFILLKNALKKGFYNVNRHNGVRVLIDREKVLLNKKTFRFRSNERRLEKAEVIEKNGVKILEFTYGWTTRGGDTTDELRIPVPSGRESEAEELVRRVL